VESEKKKAPSIKHRQRFLSLNTSLLTDGYLRWNVYVCMLRLQQMCPEGRNFPKTAHNENGTQTGLVLIIYENSSRLTKIGRVQGDQDLSLWMRHALEIAKQMPSCACAEALQCRTCLAVARQGRGWLRPHFWDRAYKQTTSNREWCSCTS